MNPTQGGRGSPNGESSHNPQANNETLHVTKEQLAVLSQAATIIGVPIETLTSLWPGPTSKTTFCSPQPAPASHDSAGDFCQDARDPSFSYDFPPPRIDMDPSATSLEHPNLSDWPSEVLPDDQQDMENAEGPFQQLLETKCQNSQPQNQFTSCIQNGFRSIDQCDRVQTSLPTEHTIRGCHPSLPLYRYSIEIPNLQQLQDFSDLFDATSISSMNADDVLAVDGPGIPAISTHLVPSAPFVGSQGNQTTISQVQYHTDENLMPSLQSTSVANHTADDDWLWRDDNLDLHGFLSGSDPGTTSSTDCDAPLKKITTSSSEGSESSWVIPTPPSPSSVNNQNHSPNYSEQSIDQEAMGMSSTGRSTPATSIARLTSLSTTTSSDLYVLGPCTRKWIIPKRGRKRAENSQNSGRDSKRPALKSSDQAPRRRGKFKTEEEKQRTALTRELSACVRCRIQRIRCEPDPSGDGPCLTCNRVAGMTMCKLPCLRYKLTAASLFRDQKSPSLFLSRRWQTMDLEDIVDWASSESKIITLTSPNLGPGTFTLEVREFVPVEGDRMEHVHVNDGQSKIIKLPPYGMVSLKGSSTRMREHLKANVGHFISATVDEQASPLIWFTFTMALKRARESSVSQNPSFLLRWDGNGHWINILQRYNEKKILSNSLELWAAGRFWSNPLHIIGSETLGVDLDDDPSSPYHARVPEIPVMLAQSQVIMSAAVMGPLQREVLHQLQTMVLANDKRNWLTIYLTVFILLHSCSMITRRNEEYAREIGLLRRFANPDSISELHMGSLIILAHFHYRNKGKLPFSLANTHQTLQQLKNIAELDDEQIRFVQMTSVYVQSIRDNIQKARDAQEFGHDMYFVSQLFDEEWKPTPIASVGED